MNDKKNNLELFYQLYDKMFDGQKNYKSEIDSVLNFYHSFNNSKNVSKVENVLEIGVGTGGHLLHIYKNASAVTGIDINPSMIQVSQKKMDDLKVSNVTLIAKSIENCNLTYNRYNLTYSLFNVINYIELSQLEVFFKTIYDVINSKQSKGLFVFDCWNGVAAIKDPPRISYKEFEFNNEKIKLELVPITDLMTQKVDLKYNFHYEPKLEKAPYLYSFTQYLHTPKEISFYLKKAGFEIVKTSKFFNLNVDANENDWKIVFVCQK